MQKSLSPIKIVRLTSEKGAVLSEPEKRVHGAAASQPFAHSQPDPLRLAQPRELPATRLQPEPGLLSPSADNPVFDEAGTARFLGVSVDCLKKWRQQKQGPDYTQYGHNGVVLYELKALTEFWYAREKEDIEASPPSGDVLSWVRLGRQSFRRVWAAIFSHLRGPV